MYNTASDAYLESRVLLASPEELIRLLYEGAIEAVRDARRHLAGADVASRAASISKASEIVAELAVSLDFTRGGDIAKRLMLLYDFVLNRLTEANISQKDEPLSEALGVLVTLSEAWQPKTHGPEPASFEAGGWIPTAQDSNYVSNCWTL